MLNQFIIIISLKFPYLHGMIDLPDRSYNISAMQNYIEYVIKKHETIAETAPILTYANKITNRIIFK